MPGLIVGAFGFQRSGKSLFVNMLAQHYHEKHGCKIYTNMDVSKDMEQHGFIEITSLDDIPLEENPTPKILLLDEVQALFDSRNWKNSSVEASLFFNSIGKQQILCLMTTINPSMVDVRIRNQMSYVVFAKGSETHIDYKVIDTQRNKSKNITVEKNSDLFSKLKYETLSIPNFIDTSLKEFPKKVEQLRVKRKNKSQVK